MSPSARLPYGSSKEAAALPHVLLQAVEQLHNSYQLLALQRAPCARATGITCDCNGAGLVWKRHDMLRAFYNRTQRQQQKCSTVYFRTRR